MSKTSQHALQDARPGYDVRVLQSRVESGLLRAKIEANAGALLSDGLAEDTAQALANREAELRNKGLLLVLDSLTRHIGRSHAEGVRTVDQLMDALEHHQQHMWKAGGEGECTAHLCLLYFSAQAEWRVCDGSLTSREVVQRQQQVC